MEDYGPDFISVVGEDGVEHEFEVLDRIITDDDVKYIALTSTEDDPELGPDEGEMIILRVIEAENGDSYLEPIEDDEEFDEIGEIFLKRMEEEIPGDEE